MAKYIEFTGGTHTTIRENFYQRQRYKEFIDKTKGNFIDTLYNPSQAHYGSRNRRFEPVFFLSEQKIMKEFSTLNPGIYVLNFVHDAFMNFRQEYSQLVQKSTIDFPPFLQNLTPTRGHESFEEKYGNYFVYTTTPYIARMEEDEKIVDFESFLIELRSIFKQELNLFPITKSGFCLSKFNSSSTTGLTIELASLEFDLDTPKGLICQSASFECYINVANNHGFLVDAHAPWRLYADLDHPVIQYLIRNPEEGPVVLEKTKNLNYQSDSVKYENFLDSVYRSKTHFDDLYHLQDFCYQTYNQIKKRVPFFPKLSYNGDIEVVYRKEPHSPSSEEWLELLLYVRMLELGFYDENTYHRLCERLKVARQVYGVKHATALIGHIAAEEISKSYGKDNRTDT